MACYLKKDGETVYLKAIDNDNDKLEFTENRDEAKTYENDWFARSELDFLKFHYPDYKEEYLEKLIPWYE